MIPPTAVANGGRLVYRSSTAEHTEARQLLNKLQTRLLKKNCFKNTISTICPGFPIAVFTKCGHLSPKWVVPLPNLAILDQNKGSDAMYLQA
jgi:hypothetical protein